jgi:hypothetical protein
VSRIWRAFGLATHRQDSWKLSKDPQFIDKFRNVVGLYLDTEKLAKPEDLAPARRSSPLPPAVL